jgi:hypothetical protein
LFREAQDGVEKTASVDIFAGFNKVGTTKVSFLALSEQVLIGQSW